MLWARPSQVPVEDRLVRARKRGGGVPRGPHGSFPPDARTSSSTKFVLEYSSNRLMCRNVAVLDLSFIYLSF